MNHDQVSAQVLPDRLRIWLLATLATTAMVCVLAAAPAFESPQFTADDYRYLSRVQRLQQDSTGSLREASIVENRWDHLWWIEATGVVRFFRPAVVLSYWLDASIHGPHNASGMLLTNVLIGIACALLVAAVIHMYVGPGLPALFGASLFAAFACHNTIVWYIAGRTDSLAALGFLAGLALHLGGRARPALRWMALPCYGFAFLTKELTVGLPLVCLLIDYSERRPGHLRDFIQERLGLYAGYAGVGLLALLVRSWGLAGAGSSLVFPYFVSPLRVGFLAHVWTQLRSYAENLLLASDTPEFMQPNELAGLTTTPGLLLAGLALGGAALLVRRDRRATVLLALGLLTWAPTAVVYLSERYLLLPSVAAAALFALGLAHLRRYRMAYGVGLLVGLCWIVHQGYVQRSENDFWMNRPRQPAMMNAHLEAVEDRIPRGAEVLIVNLPGNWLHAQFIEDQLQVRFEDPTLRARVLNVMSPIAGPGPAVWRETDRALVVMGSHLDATSIAALLYRIEESSSLVDEFPWVDLRTGARVSGDRLGFTVEVLYGESTACGGLRIFLDRPVEDYSILRWSLDPDPTLSYYDRVQRGSVALLTP